RSIILWNVSTGNIISRFIGHSDEVTSITFSPNDRLALSTSCAERDNERTCIRGEVILWNIVSGQEISELVGHNEIVNVGVFTPDAQEIITGSCGTRREGSCITGEILIWDVNAAMD